MAIYNTSGAGNIPEIYSSKRITRYNNTVAISTNYLDRLYKIDTLSTSNFESITKRITSLKLPILNLNKSINQDRGVLYRDDTKVTVNENPIYAYGIYHDRQLIYNDLCEYNYNYTNYLDGNKYVTLELYLPFAGRVPLNVENFYNRAINVSVSIDVPSCTGTYIISSVGREVTEVPDVYDTNIYVVNTIDFDFGIDMPIGMTNTGEILRNEKLTQIANRNAAITATAQVAGNFVSAIGGDTQSVSKAQGKSIVNIAEANEKIGNNNINYLNKDYPVSFSGTISGSNASKFAINIRDIFLVVTTKKTRYNNYDIINKSNEYLQYLHLCGAPLRAIKKLKSLTGYTEISSIHIENDDTAYKNLRGKCTDYEYSLLNEMLLSGIIL